MSKKTSATTAEISVRSAEAIPPCSFSEQEKLIEKKLVRKDRYAISTIPRPLSLSFLAALTGGPLGCSPNHGHHLELTTRRSSYGSARLLNLEEDLNMTGLMDQAGFIIPSGVPITCAAPCVWLRAVFIRENRELDRLDRCQLCWGRA
ncbi:hypothetical protein BJY01DRAFT_226365 [Aspergillus pseudoustus]|uniref:Uncharacterized protein n=1 Tax=Aspergillus pseudoustus TaxID=1810923 RepID=A0ABR4IVT8_9EURO